MFTIFVDTCVWWNWFTYRAGTQMDERVGEHCKNLDEIYRLVQSRPDKVRILHNKKVENELGERFKTEFMKKILPVSDKVPIPLTRLDGTYCLDGSFIYGGRMGGSLRGLLTFDGYDQELEVAKAASNLKSGKNSMIKSHANESLTLSIWSQRFRPMHTFFLQTMSEPYWNYCKELQKNMR